MASGSAKTYGRIAAAVLAAMLLAAVVFTYLSYTDCLHPDGLGDGDVASAPGW